MKLAILLVHGIGGSTDKWAEPIIESLDKKVLSELKNLLNKPDDVPQGEVKK